MKIKDFYKKHRFLLMILLVLLLGMVGGIIGEVASRSYLPETSYNMSPLGDLDFSANRATKGLVISNARNVIVEQDAKIDETIDSVRNGLVGIYKKQKNLKSNAIFSLDNFYKLDQAVGQGFIITSDGWIITNLSLEKNYADYVVITADRKVYPIDRAVGDDLTEFNFIHVAVKDFPAKKFAELSDVKSGSMAIGINWSGLSLVSSVIGFSKNDQLIRSSDNFSAKLLLNDNIQAEFKGWVIFNLAGDILGMVNNSGEIEPMAHLSGVAKNLFKNKTAKRASLGLNYINLSLLSQAGEQNEFWRKGAIIYKDQKGVGVQKNSAAEQAGLLEGDIIISLDDIQINSDNDLAGIIQGYSAGDKIAIVFIRNAQEKEMEVTLGELK